MRGKAYRWRRGTRIELLGDLAEDALIADAPLADWQREVFERAGFDVEPVGDLGEIGDQEFLLFQDNLFLSWPLLKKFLRTVRDRSQNARCSRLALAKSPLTDFSIFTGEQETVEVEGGKTGYLYGLYFMRLGPTDSVLSAMERAEPVLLDPWVKGFTIPFSSQIETMSDQELPLTDFVALELTSWVHVWMANLFQIVIWLFGFLRSPWKMIRLIGCIVRGIAMSFSLRPFRMAVGILRRLVIQGRGCRIHPTAVVEACLLGKNVEIGPHCVVRGSILGDGVKIAELSVVDASVLMKGVMVTQQGMIKVCVAHPNANFSWMQTGVVGRRAFLGRLCRPLDMKFQGEIRVMHRGKLVNTRMPFLGCCIGHRAFISADTKILPGRAIPNDYKILSDDSGYLDRIDGELPIDYLLRQRGGQLESFVPARVRAGGESPAPGADGSVQAESPGPKETIAGAPDQE